MSGSFKPMVFPFRKIEAAISSDDYIGYCILCGYEHTGIEPDARRYPCEECSNNQVYGAEEILIMDLVTHEADDNGPVDLEE